MISKKETQEKVRNSVYWAPDTKLLVQRKIRGTSTIPKQINRNLFTKVSSSNAMELNFKPDLNNEINSLSRSMKSSPSETVVMVLRNHFSLPVPEKWKQNDSWIQTRAEIVY